MSEDLEVTMKPVTFKSRIIEWGKVAGSVSAIIICVATTWAMTIGPAAELWGSFNEGVERNQQIQTAQLQTQEDLTKVIGSISTILDTQNENILRIENLEKLKAETGEPVLEFAKMGHSITDAGIGGTVVITWELYKLRGDCGAPAVGVWFRNGGNRLHRFQNISTLNADGRGVNLPPDRNRSQTLTYTARIPDDEGVHSGSAVGWSTVTYPECPSVVPVSSPETLFYILK
jgi:hypothetical protein